MHMEALLNILDDIARVPSFSSFEERLHPVIRNAMKPVEGIEWHEVADNNLVISVPGEESRAPVALSAHLDKINHFGSSPPEELPFYRAPESVTGQMDNSVGLALCISLAYLSRHHRFPPLLLLFSEMEESFGLKHHPHLLKNNGKGLYNGMGAERISEYLVENNTLPSSVITIDTTPLFKGDRGVALYSNHWEFTGAGPGEKEKSRTEQIRNEITALDPDILLSNNTNDYLHYGAVLNRDKNAGIPSLALEPAIHPYHQKNESVYLDDIARVQRIMMQWLEKTG